MGCSDNVMQISYKSDSKNFGDDKILTATWNKGQHLITLSVNANQRLKPFTLKICDVSDGDKVKIMISQDSITNFISPMYLGCCNHSYCTACPEMVRGNVYESSWYAKDGNYFWTVPVQVTSSSSKNIMLRNSSTTTSQPVTKNSSSVFVLLILVCITILIIFLVLAIIFRMDKVQIGKKQK